MRKDLLNLHTGIIRVLGDAVVPLCYQRGPHVAQFSLPEAQDKDVVKGGSKLPSFSDRSDIIFGNRCSSEM